MNLTDMGLGLGLGLVSEPRGCESGAMGSGGRKKGVEPVFEARGMDRVVCRGHGTAHLTDVMALFSSSLLSIERFPLLYPASRWYSAVLLSTTRRCQCEPAVGLFQHNNLVSKLPGLTVNHASIFEFKVFK